MHRKSLMWVFSLLFLTASCTPARLFYLPNRILYSDPAKKGLTYDMLQIKTKNGKLLSAILFKAQNELKGTVVHLHGNFGNVSCHYMGSDFLTRYGFDVIVLDYQGYGASEGRPSPRNTVEDGIAAVQYAQAHLRPGAKGVVVFGQSLGAAVGSVVTAKEPLVKAVVLEAGFYSYRAIARAVLKRSVLTWILYPIYPWLLGTTYDPIRYVPKISPRPIFFIHGNKDLVIPFSMSEKLFDAAKEPKRLWIIENAGHLECRHKKGKEYEEAVASFFSEALQK